MTELKNMQINSLTNEYLANTINEKAVEYNNNKTEFEMLIKNCWTILLSRVAIITASQIVVVYDDYYPTKGHVIDLQGLLFFLQI